MPTPVPAPTEVPSPTPVAFTVQGKLLHTDGAAASRYTVWIFAAEPSPCAEASKPGGAKTASLAGFMSQPDGSFRFRSLRPGKYLIATLSVDGARYYWWESGSRCEEATVISVTDSDLTLTFTLR